MVDEDSNLLFVYGTLRRGGGKESLLQGSRLVRVATVRGTLYDLGAYPVLVMSGESVVQGELWSCTAETLRTIDSYEGLADGLFERIPIATDDGTLCWTYVAGAGMRSRLSVAPRLASGRWASPSENFRR